MYCHIFLVTAIACLWSIMNALFYATLTGIAVNIKQPYWTCSRSVSIDNYCTGVTDIKRKYTKNKKKRQESQNKFNLKVCANDQYFWIT